jgi:hypothetical protein
MIRKIKFYKTKSSRWYADLPEWEGSKDDLEMVLGADTMLDTLAQGDDLIFLQIGDEKFPGGMQAILVEPGTIEMGGAWYLVPSIGQIDYDLKIWLCDVTKFVFGSFPETIWLYRSF